LGEPSLQDPILFSCTPLPTPAAVYYNKAETCTKQRSYLERTEYNACPPKQLISSEVS